MECREATKQKSNLSNDFLEGVAKVAHAREVSGHETAASRYDEPRQREGTSAVLHGIEATIWAAAYLWLGALGSPIDAMLYSVDSMTTLGSSGLTLQRH
jgi:hypothetical protein